MMQYVIVTSNSPHCWDDGIDQILGPFSSMQAANDCNITLNCEGDIIEILDPSKFKPSYYRYKK